MKLVCNQQVFFLKKKNCVTKFNKYLVNSIITVPISQVDGQTHTLTELQTEILKKVFPVSYNRQ